jgi:hypothetical protein
LKRENRKDPVKTVKNHVFLFKAKVFSMVSHVSQVRHFIKKGKQTSIILGLSAFLILNIFLFNSIAGQLLSTTSLQSHGTIETVGVAAYRENSCVNSMTNVEWGTIGPGGSVTRTVYIRNEGNSAVTLSLNTVNWSPTNAGNYISVSWNYGGQTIQPNQVVQITLTLSVSSSISGVDNFYFDIMIVGAS